MADPVACVQPMVDTGLLYEEDGWYLSLPVTHSFGRISSWLAGCQGLAQMFYQKRGAGSRQ